MNLQYLKLELCKCKRYTYHKCLAKAPNNLLMVEQVIWRLSLRTKEGTYMQLYTKVGDKGMTKLVNGSAVSKDSDRVWAYGTIDELNTYIGLSITKLNSNENEIKAELLHLQHCLFDLGTDLANPDLTPETMRFEPDNLSWLEKLIDRYQDEPPAIKRFMLPGGSEQSALFQVCRTTTRRAERQIVTLNWSTKLPADLLKFVNRLSDYFYAIARVINYRLHTPEVFYEHGNQVFK